MSLTSIGIWFASVIAVLASAVAFLPDGSQYPLPQQIVTGTQTLYSWLLSLNNILPVDTMVQVLFYGTVITLFAKFVWPAFMWLINSMIGVNS